MLERKVLDFLISPSFVKGDLGGFQKVKEQSKTAKKHPMETEIQQFLLKRDVDINNASRLLYIVSIMANFLIFCSIKEHAKLPNIRQEEDKADENRMEKLDHPYKLFFTFLTAKLHFPGRSERKQRIPHT